MLIFQGFSSVSSYLSPPRWVHLMGEMMDPGLITLKSLYVKFLWRYVQRSVTLTTQNLISSQCQMTPVGSLSVDSFRRNSPKNMLIIFG